MLCYVNLLKPESFEHDSSHLLTVFFGVKGGLSENTANAFLGVNTELFLESMVPHLLHSFPIFNDTVYNGVVRVEDTVQLHNLINEVSWYLAIIFHNHFVFWVTNNRGEDSARVILTSETSLLSSPSI